MQWSSTCILGSLWTGCERAKRSQREGDRSKFVSDLLSFRSRQRFIPGFWHPMTEGVNFPRNRFQVPPAPELSDPIRSVWSVRSVRSVRSVQQDFVFLFSLHLLISIGVLVFYSLAVSFLALSLSFSLLHLCFPNIHKLFLIVFLSQSIINIILRLTFPLSQSASLTFSTTFFLLPFI